MRLKRIFIYLFSTTMLLATTQQAYSFDRWEVEVKKNPFTNGVDVSSVYPISFRSQVAISCDSGKTGIRLVAIPGFEFSSDLSLITPKVKIAVDGNVISGGLNGRVKAFGANLAGVVVEIDNQQAEIITSAFAAAKRQIAIKDGISTKPFLLTARGSTKSAQKIQQCFRAQRQQAAPPLADDQSAVSKAEQILEIENQISELQSKLRALKLESGLKF